MPATNAISERSFSALCHVKVYLQSTMRLKHLMVLHIHTNNNYIDMLQIANDFVSGSEQHFW